MTLSEALQAVTRSTVAIAYLAGAIVVLLITLPLALSTLRGVLAQDELAAAVQAYHQRDPQARLLLGKLRDSSPSATASVFLGSYELEEATSLEGLESAERLFKEALELKAGHTSAVIGLIATRLRIAELGKDPKLLRSAAAEAEKTLADASEQDHPDVANLRGALLILQGKPQEGVAILVEDPRSAPTRAGQAARWWNLAVGQLLTKQNPLPAAVRAYTLRERQIPAEMSDARTKDDMGRDNDPARLLRTAYRFALADPACKPTSDEALAERAAFANRVAWLRFTSGKGKRGGQWGRYSPHREETAEVLNAVGLGLFRSGEVNLSVDAFNEACKLSKRKEPLYLLNLGQAAAIAYRRDKDVTSQRRKILHRHGRDALEVVARLLSKQKGRATLLKLAIDNRASLFYDNDAREGTAMLRRYEKDYPGPADWNRNQGAMLDWTKTDACVPFYTKAVELGHPDSAAIAERLRLWKKKNEKKKK